jgi:hypothetical protein
VRIKRIDYDDDENPAVITAQMSIDEAAFLAKLLGKMNHIRGEEVMVGGGTLHTEIWTPLAKMFNHWDDGYDEYLRGRHA